MNAVKLKIEWLRFYVSLVLAGSTPAILKKNTVLQFLLDWGLARFSGSCGFYLKHFNVNGMKKFIARSILVLVACLLLGGIVYNLQIRGLLSVIMVPILSFIALLFVIVWAIENAE